MNYNQSNKVVNSHGPAIQQPSWLTDSLQKRMSHYIARYNEIPKSILMNANNWRTDNECHTFSMMPDHTNLLYKAKEAFIDFSGLAPRIFEGADKVNVFDLYHTTGYTSLPMVISLFEEERLGKYVPVTATRDMAKNAIDSIRQTILLSMSSQVQTTFSYDMINIDIERHSFRESVKDVLDNQDLISQRYINVYLLGENTLGNLPNPELFLQHIYESMQAGEKLLLMQAIHRPGVEDLLVEDYINMLPYMQKTLQVARYISQSYVPVVNYDDEIGGITIDIKLQQPEKFGHLDLDEGRFIRIFRSKRFKMRELHSMFHKVGFKVNHILFDNSEDNAVVLLCK